MHQGDIRTIHVQMNVKTASFTTCAYVYMMHVEIVRNYKSGYYVKSTHYLTNILVCAYTVTSDSVMC
jgi:hypothetical protein